MEDLSQDRNAPGAVRCLICLNKFSGQSVATPQQCEHLYCLTCITEWAKTTNSCPVDRLEFNILYQRTGVGGSIQKIVKVEPPQTQALKDEEAADELSVCEECGRSNRRHLMLLCSACDSRFHIGCLSPPLSTLPFEDWFCEECATESSPVNDLLSREESEIDEAEIMDLLAEVSPASSRLRPSTTRQPAIYTRRSARVRQQSSRRHASVSQPVQHVPRHLLKLTCSADDTKTSNLILTPQRSDKQVTYKRRRSPFQCPNRWFIWLDMFHAAAQGKEESPYRLLVTMLTLNGYANGKKEEDFGGQKLKSLPQALLTKGQDTVKVDLQRNRLKQVTGISRLSNLTELNLSRNDLIEFPLEIKQLRRLGKLYMNQNNMKNIPDGIFPSLEKLQFLKISTNRLARLPSDLNKCQSLTYLNLSNNCLKDVQPLVGLLRLRELFVEKNQLTELPRALFQSQALAAFKANGNPLQKPPEEICAAGLKDIQNYFVMLEDSSCSVCTIKTMFLGSSMAGKSTLCRSLMCSSPVAVPEADRTVGIEIHEVDRDGVRFLFWDFAGQEEYYITHHVFITPQAFVILAIDLSRYRSDDPQSFSENVGFWINNIQLKVPNSVVLLVGTHTDQCKDAIEVLERKNDIQEKVTQMLSERKESLEQQRKNLEGLEDHSLFSDQMSDIERLTEYKLTVLDLIPVDCTMADDITWLQNHIKDLTLNKDKFPFMEQTLPQCYQEVESAIQDLLADGDIPKHGLVTQEELLYYLNGRHSGLDNDKLRCILQYLHRIGIIMWYKEISDLEDMVFVKPSFLISLFKAIVRHDLVSVLEEIPSPVLRSENALHMHKKRWISDFEERATLSNVAVRILVRKELEKAGIDDKELLEDIIGTKKKMGNLLTLLQHFDVCLATKPSFKLNATAKEFCPNKKWEPSDPSVYDPDGACLFPSFLTDNRQVREMWGEDNLEDINVQVYFLPEIPHSFFHRLVIKICSIFSTYWIGKDQCLFSCGKRRVLLRHRSVPDEDQFIEMRGKESDVQNSSDLQKMWDMIKVIMMRLAQLTQQWRGLCQCVHSPCKERGCEDYFDWGDWQDWLDSKGSEKFRMVSEEKMTCRKGHTRRTELLFPVSNSEAVTG
ncbi:hypothetical protein NFI96_031502 [Prochilodus magdalenae]|nr:hypothetical protein NFI96_031502 [Prochilodus magdalenae]